MPSTFPTPASRPRGRPKAQLVLTREERAVLERLTNRRKTCQALTLRARIILAAATGATNQEVAAKLGVNQATVGKRRRRFVAERLEGLYDEPRPGAPRNIRDDKALTLRRKTNPSLEVLLHRLNPVLRGWTNYFRCGVSEQTFSYLRAFVWRRVVGWLRGKHPRSNWKQLRRRYLPGWWPTEGEGKLLNSAGVANRGITASVVCGS